MDKTSYGAHRQSQRSPRLILVCVILVFSSFSLLFQYKSVQDSRELVKLPLHAAQSLEKCRSLHELPDPAKDFYSRTKSDRFAGTKPTFIKNTTIWTGGVEGHEVVVGDVLLHNGIIKGVGKVPSKLFRTFGQDIVTVDAAGRWLTPGKSKFHSQAYLTVLSGLVDLHSHLGVYSAPALNGAADGNSRHGITQPWLRSLDALNTHDDSFRLSIAGGLTTAVVLPGSANAIGGQAFVIKLRPTSEKTPSSMLLEPPCSLNDTSDPYPMRWRQMKQACGENPGRFSKYAGTRMDTIWAFRKAYETARQLKEKQDDYCEAALSGNWAAAAGKFPEDLQWEMLVDVLRGRVKIHNHCYEAVDLDGIVRLSNEFKFSIAAFHHAHEAYLVPDLLKKAHGHPPAVAIFATNGGYKREAYRISEFAGKILSEAGLDVVMKSDHPVLNSRYLLFEAQQAHFYGLPTNLALASVTTVPAKIMGAGHRIGSVKEGYDADVVLWDSHPLALGATPIQVFIDGIPQLTPSFHSVKPETFQSAPKVPNFDKEAKETLEYDGLPPLDGTTKSSGQGKIVFTSVGSIYLRTPGGTGVKEVFTADATSSSQDFVVVVENGSIVCVGLCSDLQLGATTRIDLEGGSISPSLVSYGSPLGLSAIGSEPSTSDGLMIDPLLNKVTEIPVIKAVDGLLFDTRDALHAYRSGVSVGIVAPTVGANGLFGGISTAFSTSAKTKLVKGAVIQDAVALHFRVTMASAVSVSTQIGILRKVLMGEVKGDLGDIVDKATLPIVIDVHSADAMASLLVLKAEIEQKWGHTLRMVFTGATEAHLIAKEIGEAGVGVIVTAPRPYPTIWEYQRLLPGPPLSKSSAITVLIQNNVTVAIGVTEKYQIRSTRFDLAWVALESDGAISKTEALALASVNLENLLGIASENSATDLVVTKGGEMFDFSGKVIGVLSSRRGLVDLL
ncbi:carbohydrate esterase family 9 protein [Mycena floridula]|nr:carbohydrate esterase family 9 protein [Mycena floridula]